MPKIVSFQANRFQITENVLPTWRRARTSLSNAVKAHTRAAHFQHLRTLRLPTLWSLGVGRLPAFLPVDTDAKTAIVAAKRAHAMDLLAIVEQACLRRKESETSIGTTFRTAFQTQYGENTESCDQADTLLNSLIQRDEAQTNTTLNQRLAKAQANPITSDMILANVVCTPATRNPVIQERRAPAAAPAAARARTPSPNNRARGRGQGRGRGRGRGAPARGRGATRSRSHNGPRPRSRSPPARDINLNAQELAVVLAMRT